MWGDILNKVKPETIEHAALQWDADLDTLKLVNKGINLVYSFKSKVDENFLRFTHASLRSLGELNSAIHFQTFLYQHGAPVCKPLLSSRDNYVEECPQDKELFYAHVNAGLQGELFELKTDKKEDYIAWGEALARVHLAALEYQAPENSSFKTWQELWQETESYITKDDDVVWNEYMQIKEWLQGKKNFNLELYGLTHGDHRAGNVIYSNGTVSIIDFDEPVYHWLHADIARTLLDLDQTQVQSFKWYLSGYQKFIALNQFDIEALVWFARLKNLEIYLWMKNNWVQHDASGKEKFNSTLLKLHRCMRYPELLQNFVAS